MRWTLGLVLALPGAAAAQSSILGNWCEEGPEGDTIYYIEADSLGVHEHTMCDWRDPPTGLSLTTMIDCRNVYLYEGSVIETEHQSFDFTAELRADGTLLVTVGDESPVVFHRCAY